MSMPGLNGVATPGRGRADAGHALFGPGRELNVLDGLLDGIGDRGAAGNPLALAELPIAEAASRR
jgi:hypothetical protein